ncbi:MAG: hypothetical protein EOM55_03900 [Clostridia bacterium]|nr:hypothetical protein [Clostridia bacterium]
MITSKSEMIMLDESENKASRGSVPQIILTILSQNSQYGYKICKEIERMTNGELVLKQPSLYSSLRRLEAQELISSSWQDSEIGAKRHYYFLTEKGKKYFEENKHEWKLGELIYKLPTSELKEDCDESIQKNRTDYSVASQENLFNLHSKKNEIRKIIENNEKDDNQFFFQFDLFNQDVKTVKKPSIEVKKVEVYSNQFQKYDNNEVDIEPIRTESEDKIIKKHFEFEKTSSQNDEYKKEEILSIIRDTPPRNSFEEDNKSNFDISELVENNSAPSPIFSDEIKDNSASSALSSDEKEKEKSTTNEISGNENADEKEIEIKNDKENIDENLDKKEEPKNKIERENPVKQPILFESNDYRSVIGKLFSNSQKSDPYEQNKFNTFKEIFPQTNIMIVEEKKKTNSEIDKFVESSSKSDIECDDIDTLSNLFNLQGIKIKTHKNIQNKKNCKAYTDKNKLNMVSSWIISLLMLLEITFTYLFLNNSGNLVRGQSLLFFLSVALVLSIFLVFTLENMFDRYKLVVLKIDFKKGLTFRILCFIIITVLTFAICLAFGMQGLSQVEFLAFWLLPVILSSNIIVSYLIYYFLLSHKYFNS